MREILIDFNSYGGKQGRNYEITSSFGPSIVPFNWRPHRFSTTGYSGKTEKSAKTEKRINLICLIAIARSLVRLFYQNVNDRHIDI